MNKLSSGARNVLVVLIVALIFIFGSFMAIYTSLLIAHQPAKHRAELIKQLRQLRYQLKKHHTNSQFILARYEKPWLSLSLTKKAQYTKQGLQVLNSQMPHGMDKFSLRIDSNLWLNVSIDKTKRPPSGLSFGMLGSLGISLVLLLLVCYWAVKKLSTPTRQLLQHLDYALDQEQWQAIPLVGSVEQIEVYKRINALQEKLNKLLADRTHMLAAISHDLRTPLTRLKLRSEYFQDSKQYKKLSNDIQDMEVMINESLDYFRDINHNETVQKINLVALMQAICEDFNDMGEDAHLASKDSSIIYEGRINLLKRAFSNIISNAIHYGQKAEVFLHKHDAHLEIIIEDSGPGLNCDEIDKATSPYYRSEHSRSRKTGGVGLGLSIAKEIIQLHNGSLRISNRVEGGLRVSIELPLK